MECAVPKLDRRHVYVHTFVFPAHQPNRGEALRVTCWVDSDWTAHHACRTLEIGAFFAASTRYIFIFCETKGEGAPESKRAGRPTCSEQAVESSWPSASHCIESDVGDQMVWAHFKQASRVQRRLLFSCVTVQPIEIFSVGTCVLATRWCCRASWVEKYVFRITLPSAIVGKTPVDTLHFLEKPGRRNLR